MRPAGAQSELLSANVSEQYLKTAADQERAALGLPPLRLDSALVRASRQHAAMMAAHNSISHRYPEEADLSGRAATAGARFSLITENVAQAPSAVMVHTAWMRSEGHRHNLLDPRVDSVGISVVSRSGQMFAVEDFARSVASVTLDRQELVVSRAVRAYGLSILPTGEQARRICSGTSAKEMQLAPEFAMRYTTDDLERLPSELSLKLRSGQYSNATVAACETGRREDFAMFQVAVLLSRR